MKTIIATSRKHWFVITAVMLAIAGAGLTVVFKVRAKPTQINSPTNAVAGASSVSKAFKGMPPANHFTRYTATARVLGQNAEFRQGVRIWVQNDGVHPPIVKPLTGKLRINVENGANADISVVMDRRGANGQGHLLVIQVGQNDKRNHKDVDLEPGEYIFYEASRSELKGRLIVAPQP